MSPVGRRRLLAGIAALVPAWPGRAQLPETPAAAPPMAPASPGGSSQPTPAPAAGAAPQGATAEAEAPAPPPRRRPPRRRAVRRRPPDQAPPPQTEATGPRLDAAPVPNRSIEGPRAASPSESPSLSPSIIHRPLPSVGAARDGARNYDEERLFFPAPGARLTVPF